MKGTMIIYDLDGIAPRRIELDKTPTLEALQQAVGGLIEKVPYFDRMRLEGEWRNCVALCDEEGKLKELPINRQATLIWAQILENNGLEIRDEKGNFRDVLVGPIVVLYGDNEFMAAL